MSGLTVSRKIGQKLIAKTQHGDVTLTVTRLDRQEIKLTINTKSGNSSVKVKVGQITAVPVLQDTVSVSIKQLTRSSVKFSLMSNALVFHRGEVCTVG